MDDALTYDELIGRATTEYENKNYDQAASLFQMAADRSPGLDKSHAYAVIGNCFRLGGEYPQAETNYLKALALVPDLKTASPPNHFLGELLYGLGFVVKAQPTPPGAATRNDEKAEKNYEESVKFYGSEDSSRAYPLKELGDILQARGQFPKGAAKYRAAIEAGEGLQEPFRKSFLADAYNGLGIAVAGKSARERAGKLAPEAVAEGISSFKASARYYAGNSDRRHPLANLGHLLLHQKRNPEAAEAYREAISSIPQPIESKDLEVFLADTYRLLGVTLAAMNNIDVYGETISSYEAVLGFKATSISVRATTLNDWGNALLDQGSRLEAKADYDKAQNEYRNAIKKYNEARAAKPDYVAPVNGRGRAFYQLGQLDDALRCFEVAADEWAKIPDETANRAVALNNCGLTFRRLWRLEDAKRRFKDAIEAIEATPKDQARFADQNGLGDILATQENKDACDAFMKADEIARADRDPPALQQRIGNFCQLGDALLNLEDFARAESAYRRALDLPLPEAGSTTADDQADEGTKSDPLAGAKNGLAWAIAGQERFKSALEAFPEATRDRAPPYAMRTRGDHLLYRDEYEEAEAAYRRALQTDLDSDAVNNDNTPWNGAWTCFGLANVLTARGEFAEAISLLRDGLRSAGRRIERLRKNAPRAKGDREMEERAIVFMRHNLAYALRNCGRYAEASKELASVVDDYNTYISTYEPDVLSDVYFYYGTTLSDIFTNFAQAEASYNKSIKTGRNNLRAYLALAKLYKQRASLAGEAGATPAWWDLRPRAPSLTRIDYEGKFAQVVREARKLVDQALAPIEKARSKAKSSGAASTPSGKPEYATRVAAADFHILCEDYDAAEDELKKVQTYLRDNSEELGGSVIRQAEIDAKLARIALKREAFDQAAIRYRKAIKSSADSLSLTAELGNCLYIAKNRADAERQYRLVLQKAPGNVEALMGLARICADLGDEGATERYGEAERYLNVILQEPASGALSTRSTRWMRAETYYLRGYVHSKAPGRGGSTLNVSRAGNYRRALADFSRCIDNDPQNFKAIDAKTKLKAYLSETVDNGAITLGGSLLVIVLGVFMFCATQYLLFENVGDVGGGPASSAPPWIKSALGLMGLSIQETAGRRSIDFVSYIALSFGSIMVIVSGLFLPYITSLKAGPIELQKSGGPISGAALSSPEILRPDNPFLSGSATGTPPGRSG